MSENEDTYTGPYIAPLDPTRRTSDLMFAALAEVMQGRGYIDIPWNEPWDAAGEGWEPGEEVRELADDLAEAFDRLRADMSTELPPPDRMGRAIG